MEIIYRIIGRLPIPSRGVIYTMRAELAGNLSLGDVLYDLQKNSFRISGFEMFRMASDRVDPKETIGLMLEGIERREVQGDLLIDCVPSVNVLFCANPLTRGQVDEEYADEFAAASRSHSCALLDYESIRNGKLKISGAPISGLTLYRGWMLTPTQYRCLYEQLVQQNIILINTPAQYEHYHLLPNWYPEFESETAPSVWDSSDEMAAAIALTRELQGAYIVKDYVKSRKHEWYDACYIPNIQDETRTETIIGNFVSRQGSDLAGGVVLRKFVPLKRIGYHEQSGMPISEEYRAFILAGKVMLLDCYWNGEYGALLSAEERCWIDSVAARITSNFATVDIARKEDGTLMVMEMGDGQVSGLQQLSPDDFYRAI